MHKKVSSVMRLDEEEDKGMVTIPEQADAILRCQGCGYNQCMAMRHLYRMCYRCGREVTKSSVLPSPEMEKLPPIWVMAAAYGHITDPAKAFDVTERVRHLISSHGKGRENKLVIPVDLDLRVVFGDPCPDDPKALKVRYVLRGRRAEVEAREAVPGFLDQELFIRCPDEPFSLNIYEASYGPRGSGTYDAMGLIDVTERICGIADTLGGSYVDIPSNRPLADLFGSPSGEDRKKHLTIRYEIEGNQGKVEQIEFDKHSMMPLEIAAAVPKLEPLIVITSALYGRTREMVQERTKEIQESISQVYGIQAKKAAGLNLSAADLQVLSSYPSLHDEIQDMMTNQIRNVDVTYQVQRRVEAAGGDLLHFTVNEDINAIFSNPCPGVKKELRIRYLCIGSDADLTTTSEELTTRGFQRNAITHVAGEVAVQVRDDENGRGLLQNDIKVVSQKAFPLLDVVVAKYGSPIEPLRMKDVTTEVRRIVLQQGGWKLYIPADANLDDLLGKCYSGGRKKLVVTYMLRGLVGVFRCDEVQGFIRSHVRLGYPNDSNKYLEEEGDSVASVTRMERTREVHVEDFDTRLHEYRRYEIASIDMPLNQPRWAVHRYCQQRRREKDVVQEKYCPRDAHLSGRLRKGQMKVTSQAAAVSAHPLNNNIGENDECIGRAKDEDARYFYSHDQK